jgi:hypothetical protein
MLWAGVQVFQWLVVVSTDAPTSDPCIPQARRPPAYLSPLFLTRVDAVIDAAADFIAPCLLARRPFRTCYHPLLSWWAQCTPVLPRQWPPWRSRPRSLMLTCSLIHAGIARAHSVAADRETREQIIFDTDSFDILVDGGAISCISNNLTDFVSPPQASEVRVQGFNEITNSSKIGTVKWTVLR